MAVPVVSVDVDQAISASIRALAAGRGLTHGGVAEAVGIPRSTFERRLAKGGWTATEAVRLAEWFEVTLDDLVTGLQGHVGLST
ncbi:MAG: helix-turn-helix domain-containing protein [Nocardioidaceae bacterium]